MSHSVAVAVLLLSSALLEPGQSPYSSGYAQCQDDSEGVTLEMHECIGKELELQDARLNRAYRVLRSEVSQERRRQLTGVQRAWLQYRDANCDFYADPAGGTAASLSAHACVLRMTAERAVELENLKAP
jgi:uncharacterized protein YecT (DUF1311 family)